MYRHLARSGLLQQQQAVESVVGMQRRDGPRLAYIGAKDIGSRDDAVPFASGQP